MSRVVLDASALLAVLHAERGAEKMTPALLAAALISAVNLAEVQTKLVSRGVRPGDAWDAALSVVCEVVPFSKEHARKAGDLALQTRSLGLGLGDRASLALALSLGVPVYTADASWSRLKIGAAIHVIR